MTVYRVPVQSLELADALWDAPDGVLRRAAQVVLHVMAGDVVVIEERIGSVGDEDVIEETVLEAGVAGA